MCYIVGVEDHEPSPEGPSKDEKQERMLAQLAHAAYIFGIPLILPIGIWLWKSDSPFVVQHAKFATAIQLLCMLPVPLFIALQPHPLFIIPFLFLVMAAIVPMVWAALKASKGQPLPWPKMG